MFGVTYIGSNYAKQILGRGCAHKIGNFFFCLNDFFMHEWC